MNLASFEDMAVKKPWESYPASCFGRHRNITQNQSEHSEFSPISGERDLDCICKCGGAVIRNVDSREVAGFKERGI